MRDEYLIEEKTYKGMTIKIMSDDDPESPREWENFGKMACVHSRYNLGDEDHSDELKIITNECGNWDECEAELKKRAVENGDPIAVILPISIYDHSGITMFVGGASGWDCGKVGFIYCTKKDILKEWGGKYLTKKMLKKAEDLLNGEVETYDVYIRGDVVGYMIMDENGEDIDDGSCWGYYSTEDAIADAKSVIDYHIVYEAKKSIAAIDKMLLDASARTTNQWGA